MRKVILIGETGQLARALIERLPKHDMQIIGCYGRSHQDLSASKDEIKNFARKMPEADGLIFASAYTAVDKAETDGDTAHAVNVIAPSIFATECASRNIPLVHVSTDYVFSGEADQPWEPCHDTAPINIYGQTKRDGELAIIETNARAAIHRTSWVYDGTGKNFLQTMLRLAKDRDSLSVVNDQLGRPTYAGHLAEACIASLKKLISEDEFQGGIFHVSNTGNPISWADFARSIFDVAKTHIAHPMTVTGIPSSDYPTPAKRPSYSVLNTNSFETTFDYILPSWKEGLNAAFREWEAMNKL